MACRTCRYSTNTPVLHSIKINTREKEKSRKSLAHDHLSFDLYCTVQCSADILYLALFYSATCALVNSLVLVLPPCKPDTLVIRRRNIAHRRCVNRYFPSKSIPTDQFPSPSDTPPAVHFVPESQIPPLSRSPHFARLSLPSPCLALIP